MAQFTNQPVGLPGISSGSAVWGDYDHDGDLDILISGTTNGFSSGVITQIYRNDNGQFIDIRADLPGLIYVSAAWGDYDNDGDLDFVLTGWDPAVTNNITRIYQNDGGVFTDLQANLPGGAAGSVAWGDLDNDGDLDLLITGQLPPIVWAARIYWNDHGKFTNFTTLPVVQYQGGVALGDFDNDGDLDILMTGHGAGTVVLRNEGHGVFTNIAAGLPPVFISSAAWGDYDNDGFLDILLAGDNDAGGLTRIYRNNGDGTFTDIRADLAPVVDCAVAWGDYDNDGAMDVAITGGGPGVGGRLTRIYHNDNGSFTNFFDVQGAWFGSVALGDYNNDGNLDILLSGYAYTPVYANICWLYRNNGINKNSPPTAPSRLSASVASNTVVLDWGTAADAETPTAGLTYNLRVGTTPGGSEIVPPHSSSLTGLRYLPAFGNMQHQTNAIFKNLAPGLYYWGVQAVDTSFAGGPFSTERFFLVGNRPHLLSVEAQSGGGFRTEALGAPNAAYTLEASADLQTWTSSGLMTTSGSDGHFSFFLPPSGNERRFFRAKVP